MSVSKIQFSALKLLHWFNNIQNDETLNTPMNLSRLIFSINRAKKIKILNSHYNNLELLIDKLIGMQNSDGSWNEIYFNYGINTKSTLATAFVATRLLKLLYDKCKSNHKLKTSVIKAAEYVSKQEIQPGFFLKSEIINEDTVNVNMVCALFFLYMHNFTNDRLFIEIANRTVNRVIKTQLSSGVFPYYTKKKLYLTPMHYHTFSTNMLAEFYLLSPNKNVLSSLNSSVDYITTHLDTHGRIKWHNELNHFVYRIFSTYGSALQCLLFFSKIDAKFLLFAEKVLNGVLKSQLYDYSFPAFDCHKSAKAILIDLENSLKLISHLHFVDGAILIKYAIKANEQMFAHHKIVVNVQMLDSLLASYELLANSKSFMRA